MPPPAALGHVRFTDVHFAYPSRPAAPILRGVTLEAPPGKQLALVGPSGSGKSTLFLLLEGFYAPSSGSVTLDGLNVRAAPPQWLHAALGLVAQEPVLFSGSIAENILYCSRAQAASQRDEAADTACDTYPPGAAALTPGELRSAEAAAKLAHAHGFVSALPQGYGTPIGERGVQLSGGQRQRLGAFVVRARHRAQVH
jgi:ATP-binding cassette subfamily B protein